MNYSLVCTVRVGNVGIVANFVFPYIYSFLSLLTSTGVGKCEIGSEGIIEDN